MKIQLEKLCVKLFLQKHNCQRTRLTRSKFRWRWWRLLHPKVCPNAPHYTSRTAGQKLSGWLDIGYECVKCLRRQKIPNRLQTPPIYAETDQALLQWTQRVDYSDDFINLKHNRSCFSKMWKLRIFVRFQRQPSYLCPSYSNHYIVNSKPSPSVKNQFCELFFILILHLPYSPHYRRNNYIGCILKSSLRIVFRMQWYYIIEFKFNYR